MWHLYINNTFAFNERPESVREPHYDLCTPTIRIGCTWRALTQKEAFTREIFPDLDVLSRMGLIVPVLSVSLLIQKFYF